MKEIILTQGKVALVDDEDFEYLNQWKWFAANPCRDTWYAKRTDNKHKKSIRMHRVLMNATEIEDFIDHKDGNGLNNQKSNLRRCSRSQNSANRKHNQSGYIGISFHRKWRMNVTKDGENRISEYSKWWASIKSNGKTINIGGFKTKEEAALAYNEVAIKVHGEFANLNVID